MTLIGKSGRFINEVYCDYLAVNSDLFEFEAPKLPKDFLKFNKDSSLFRRHISGMMSVLLSLRQRPTIRFQNGSDIAQTFARALLHEIDQERTLFDFGSYAPSSNSNGDTLCLILDRREDPVTPLLCQWTYQAMVHELLGLKHNVVDLGEEYIRKKMLEGSTDSDLKNLRNVVLSQSDDFFAANMYKDFGALSSNVQRLVTDYKRKFEENKKNLGSIEQISNVVENLPEFKKFANNALKHSAIAGEISSKIAREDLIQVSLIEQDLVDPTSDHSSNLEKVKDKIKSANISPDRKLCLALLYALRYETHGGNRIAELKQLLRTHVREDKVKLIDALLNYAGNARRSNPSDLFGGNSDFFKAIGALA